VNTNKVVTNILQGSVVTQTVRWANLTIYPQLQISYSVKIYAKNCENW